MHRMEIAGARSRFSIMGSDRGNSESVIDDERLLSDE